MTEASSNLSGEKSAFNRNRREFLPAAIVGAAIPNVAASLKRKVDKISASLIRKPHQMK